MSLPLVIAPGDPGHIGHHEEIHDLLSRLDGQTDFLVVGAFQDVIGSLPAAAAGNLGLLSYATDTDRLRYSDGGAWRDLAIVGLPNNFTAAQTFSDDLYADGDARFKTLPWADPMHPDFGAVGDGVADDTDPWQDAIDTASGIGRGEVHPTPNIYLVTGLSLSDKPVKIAATGHRGTIVKGNGTAHVITMTHATETTGTVIEDLGFSFTLTSQVTYDCVNIGANVTMFNFTRCSFGHARRGITIAANADIAEIVDCTFGSYLNYGIYGDTGTANVTISGNWFNENRTTGIYFNGVDSTIVGNRFSRSGIGIQLDAGALRNTVQANSFGLTAAAWDGGSTSGGIRVYGDDNVITGNYVGNHTNIDINLEAGSSGNIISNNHLGGGTIVDNSSGANSQWGNSDGRFLLPASVTGGAKFRLAHGAAPSSPVDGDIWTTTAGLFVRVNGSTVGPLS